MNKISIVGLLFFIGLSCAIAAKKDSLPRDPWREIGGQTNLAVGSGWMHFYGEALQVMPNSVRIRGRYHTPGKDLFGEEFIFIVFNFPYQLADNEQIPYPSNFVAKEDGTFTYRTAIGGTATVRKLEYGHPCRQPLPPQPSAEEIAKAKASSEKKKAQQSAKVLKHHQDLAEKNDPYGLYKMGERHLTGDGVPKDLAKARNLLSRAAALGQQDAGELLKKCQ